MPGNITLVAASDRSALLVLGHTLFGLLEVFYNLVVDIIYGGAGGDGLVRILQTEGNSGMGCIGGIFVRHSEQIHHLEVAEGAEEQVLTHKVAVQVRLF